MQWFRVRITRRVRQTTHVYVETTSARRAIRAARRLEREGHVDWSGAVAHPGRGDSDGSDFKVA